MPLPFSSICCSKTFIVSASINLVSCFMRFSLLALQILEQILRKHDRNYFLHNYILFGELYWSWYPLFRNKQNCSPRSLLSFLPLFRSDRVYQPLYLVAEKTLQLLLATVNWIALQNIKYKGFRQQTLAVVTLTHKKNHRKTFKGKCQKNRTELKPRKSS